MLGFADRPVTAFDPDRHLGIACCAPTIPTLANGGAVMEAAGWPAWR